MINTPDRAAAGAQDEVKLVACVCCVAACCTDARPLSTNQGNIKQLQCAFTFSLMEACCSLQSRFVFCALYRRPTGSSTYNTRAKHTDHANTDGVRQPEGLYFVAAGLCRGHNARGVCKWAGQLFDALCSFSLGVAPARVVNTAGGETTVHKVTTALLGSRCLSSSLC